MTTPFTKSSGYMKSIIEAAEKVLIEDALTEEKTNLSSILKKHGWSENKSRAGIGKVYQHKDHPNQHILTIGRGAAGALSMWYHKDDAEAHNSTGKHGFGRGTYNLEQHLSDFHKRNVNEASNEAPTINHLELSEEPAKKADDTPPFDPDPPRVKRPDEPKTAKGLARSAMVKQIHAKAVAEKKRLRKSLREEESEQIDETLKAIVTRKNKDGSYDEVGTSNRTVVQGTDSVVKRKAREWAKGAHRIELHYPSKFYKEPHKTIHVSEESEQVAEREMTAAEKAKKEKYVKSMKSASDWEKRYPGRGKEVMYATATKQAMKEEIEVKEKSQASKIKKMVKGKTEAIKGGKTLTGKTCDQVNVNPVHTDGIMSGTNTQSGVQ